MTTVVEAFRLSVKGFPDTPISRDSIAKLPYATISAKIGKGPKSILVLWRVQRDEQHWLSADDAVVVTRQGRVVRTVGFPENIVASRTLPEDPLSPGLLSAGLNRNYVRLLELSLEGRRSVLLNSSFEIVGPKTIEIIEIEFETILVRERNIAREENWEFENLFWVDPADGFVWKSVQHIARTFPPIEIEVLKPAG